MRTALRVAASVLVVAFVAGCMKDTGQDERKLTAAEVREIFIGTPWHGPSGAFLFREDGTYTYKDFASSTPRGTWDYEMTAEGVIEGETTNYTFYEGPDGYRYFHSRSSQFYPAEPNKPDFM